MPMKKRNWKQEYKTQVERGEDKDQLERQRARRKLDAKGVARKGKDVAHKKALDKGGSNGDGVFIESAAKNRSFKRDSKGNLVSETSKKERKNS